MKITTKLVLALSIGCLAPKVAMAAAYAPAALLTHVGQLVDDVRPFSGPGPKSLCFVSAESSHDLGTVTNCVVQIKDGANSLWLMRQDIVAKQGKIQNLIATYVDTQSGARPTAYYLELNRTKYESVSAVEPIPYKVPCLMCHASGPRLIRPTSDSVAKFSMAQRDLLTRWNEEIGAYKIVDNYIPPSAEGTGLLTSGPNDHETLKLPKCLECHNSNTGVRRELTRGNRTTIAYLAFLSKEDLGSTQMPSFGAQQLNLAEAQCLREWLHGHRPDGCHEVVGDNKQVAGVDSFTKARTGPADTRPTIDGEKSNIRILVTTTFHNFEVTGLSPECGPIETKPSSGEPVIQCNLSLLTLNTGLSVRTTNAKAWLETNLFPSIAVSGTLGSDGLLRGTLKIKELARAFESRVACIPAEHRCDLLPTTINLANWELKMPGFLGISVKPEVVVSGSVAIR
jgi:hypothetical protein